MTPGPSSTPASRRIPRSVAHRRRSSPTRRPPSVVLARAVMNGETVDPIGWRTMFPTLFGPSATGDAAELARSEAILEASLAVADRGEQVRSQVRGALVEEVTAQLLARRVGADAVRRERRILFDGVRGGDPPVRRDGRTRAGPPRRTTASGAPAASTPTSSTSSTTPGRTPPTRTSALAVALVVFDARRSCDVRLAQQTAPHEGTARRHARDARWRWPSRGRDRARTAVPRRTASGSTSAGRTG